MAQVEEIGLEEMAELHGDSDNTTDDIHTAIEAFAVAVSHIVVCDQAPLDS